MGKQALIKSDGGSLFVHETCVGVFKTNFESQMSRRITNLASRNVVGNAPTHWKSN